MKTMKRLPSPEKGSILVWTIVMLAVLIAFTALATDIPYLYVARQQAQTAADAGAIAGAYGLLVNQAKTDAKALAKKTQIIGQFLTDPQIDAFTCNSNGGTIGECAADSANPDQVTCVTHRDVAHSNPMPLFLMPVLSIFGLGPATADHSGSDAANVGAAATARRVNACSSDCFKPWSVTDKWVDTNGNGKFDNGVDLYDPVTTGYQYPRDNGLQVTLKIGKPGDNIVPSFYNAVDFPPLNRGTPQTGGNTYQDNISTCGPDSFVAVGDQLQTEPGSMQGPTAQGVQDLIATDPTAYWDTGCNCANSPKGINSARLIRIGFFDPRDPPSSGRQSVTVIKVGGFFVESVVSSGPNKGNVTGRFTQVAAFGGAPDPGCAGLQTVRLVK